MSKGKTVEQRLAWLKSLPPEDKEGICVDCGACCMGAVDIEGEGKVIIASLPCRFLEFEEGKSRCSVYSKRFEKASWCHDIEGMIRKGLAPPECPYVEGIEGYKGKNIKRGQDYVRAERLTRNHFRRNPPPFEEKKFARDEDWNRFLRAAP